VQPFPAFNQLKQCRHGMMLYNMNDSYIGRSLDLYGEYSEGEIEIFQQGVRPGNTVIEVGANIGAHTVALAQLAGQDGMVLAFEPQRIVYQTLCANIAINSIPNVICLQHAVGAEPGELRVPLLDYSRECNFGGLSLGEFDIGERVPIVTLDSYNLANCHFIKCDVEGMEEQALRGAVNLISRCRPVLYVENDKEEKSDSLIRYIDSIGYRMYWHRPFYFSPKNFLNNPHDVFPSIASLNMLCIHKDFPQNLQGFEDVVVPPPAAQITT